jgi:hypothetical protein
MSINGFERIITLGAVVGCLAGLAACGKNNKDPKAELVATPQSELKVDALLAEQGCLSAEKLSLEFGGLSGNLSVNIVPTQIQFESNKSIRPNFEKLIALNQLVIEEKPLSAIDDIEPAVQTNCESVTLNRASGAKEFKIKDHSQKGLRFQSEDGEEIEYKILGSRALQITKKYITHDVPCQNEKTPIFVKVKKLFDWTGTPVPDTVDSKSSEFSIDNSFLSLASQAVGINEADFYVSGESQQMLRISKVREVAQMPPLPEVVSCTGAVGEPEEPTESLAPTEPNPVNEEGEGNRAAG